MRKWRILKRISLGFVMFISLVSIAFLIADNFLKGSLSFYVLNVLINHPVGQILVKIGTKLLLPLMTTSDIRLNVLIFLIPIALLIVNIFIIKRLKMKEKSKIISHLILHFCFSFFVISFTIATTYTNYAVFVVNHFLLADSTTKLKDVNNFEKIQKTTKTSKAMGQKVIHTLILELKEDNQLIDNLETPLYMEIAETVALCFQIKGTVNSKEEHYLRNYFSRAPQTLDALIQEVKDKSPFGWRLLEQWETVYHMQGKNGAYNVKFVSEDGYHEAIYNKEGVLLTEKNDPVNMGTFNYTDPTGEPAMHVALDVLPYYSYGNCPASPKSSKENYDYQKYPDAQKHWQDLKKLLDSLNK